MNSPKPASAEVGHVSEPEGDNQAQYSSPTLEAHQTPNLPSITVTPLLGDRDLHELGEGGTPLLDQGLDQHGVQMMPQDDARHVHLTPASPWDPPIPSHLLSHTATEEVSFLIYNNC